MNRLSHVVLLFALTACSARETSDAPDGVLVKQTVSSTSGAMIFHDGDPMVVLSIPPSAVAADVELTISAAKAELGADTASPVISIAPEATPLAFPGSLSIAVETATPGMVIARVTDVGLERLSGSAVDTATREVHGEVVRLGRFVVVDSYVAKLIEPSTPAASLTSTVPGVLPGPVATGTGLDIAGTWQGVGAHEGFALSLIDSQFDVSKDGAVVREGSFTLNGNQLGLHDSSGSTEAATVTLNGDELTLESAASGVVRWQRLVPIATAEPAPRGFFAVHPDPQPPPTTSSGAAPVQGAPPKQNQAASAPASQASAPTLKSPRTSADSLASSTAASGNASAPPKKKNFFQRVGSGLKNAGKNVVQGVKNLGKSTAEQTQATVEQQVALTEQAVEGTIVQTEGQVVGGMNAASGQVSGAIAGTMSNARANAGLPAGGGGVTPLSGSTGGVCSLISPVTAAIAIGADQQPARMVNDASCEIRGNRGGLVGVSLDPGDGRVPTWVIDGYRKNNQCSAPVAVGDEACVLSLGGQHVKLVFRKGAVIGTVEVQTLNADPVAASVQIAQSIAVQI